MKSFFRKQWFLIGLVMVLIIGFSFWGHMTWLADLKWLRNLVVATVLFLMALPLETKTMWRTLSRPGPALLATVINMGLVPALGGLFAKFAPSDFRHGIIVACVSPCTMASAAVWTRRANGNDAVAIMVTILTNLTCFILTPLWLNLLVGQSVKMELLPTISKLGLLVVLPMVIGQLIRLSANVRLVTTARKPLISTLAQCGILFMVLVGAIECGRSLDSANVANQVSVPAFLGMTCLVTVIHIGSLAIGVLSAKTLQMDPQNQIAVGIAGSQKTLMVGLYIALNFFGGLAILPMVTYHVSQLFLDTFVVDAWRKRYPTEDNTNVGL